MESCLNINVIKYKRIINLVQYIKLRKRNMNNKCLKMLFYPAGYLSKMHELTLFD